ncbi:MAG: CinA family protein [Candidatus Omnitrophica bacterium]|nr:CinA family protein [Candidatus Omnitrophota bacterium]
MEELKSLAEEVGGLLLAQKLTLGLAESCTGGLLAAAITDVPGSSGYFNGGIVAYRNKVKKKVLKVTTPCLHKFGAVSAETATAMARGARKATTARVGLSITGIAGPSGETKDKPVGLVYIALDARKLPLTLPSPLRGEDKKIVRQFNFSGNRQEIRQDACIKALELLKEFLTQTTPIRIQK